MSINLLSANSKNGQTLSNKFVGKSRSTSVSGKFYFINLYSILYFVSITKKFKAQFLGLSVFFQSRQSQPQQRILKSFCGQLIYQLQNFCQINLFGHDRLFNNFYILQVFNELKKVNISQYQSLPVSKPIESNLRQYY